MKEIIFAVIIVGVISLFAVNSLALAKTSPNASPSDDIWFAINDLKNQVKSLQSELDAAKKQGLSENVGTTSDAKKTVKGKTITEKEDSPISRSEHFTMVGFSIP